MADYAYDVFISYRRTKHVLKWVTKYFREEFVAWLHEARGVTPRVFWDEEGIGAGDDLNERLKDALLRSKCLVAVLSPSYFRESRWCVSEFRTFRQRSEKLGLKVPGLVVPALWQTWDRFPPDVKALKMFEFESYATIKTVTKTFSDNVKAFAMRVAEVVDLAPPYDPSFEFVWADRLDVPIEQRTLSHAVAA